MEDAHRHPRPKRTGHSHVPHTPGRPHDREHKRAVMVIGVGLCMVVLTALYAASFTYRDLVPNADEGSRWGLLADDLKKDVTPFTEDVLDLKNSIAQVLEARNARAESIEIMKQRLLTASATGSAETGPTENATATPETP